MTDKFFQDRDNAGKTISGKLMRKVEDSANDYRTVVISDGNTTTMLKTKGGMPEVTQSKKINTDPVYLKSAPKRSFVFRTHAAPRPTTGRISKRNGAGMKTVLSAYSPIGEKVSYFVLPTATEFPGYDGVVYNDVCRLSGNDFTMNNGDVALPAFGWVLNDQSSAIPYVVKNALGKYQQLAGGTPGDRATLCVGTQNGVYSISNTDGNPLGEVTFDRTNLVAAYDSGVYCSKDGVFTLCGGKLKLGYAYVGYPSGYPLSSFVRSMTVAKSAIVATFDSPYLENSGASETTIVYEAYPPLTPTAPPGEVAWSGPVVSPQYSGNLTIPAIKSVITTILEDLGNGNARVRYSTDGGQTHYFNVTHSTPATPTKPAVTVSSTETERFNDGSPFAVDIIYSVNGFDSISVQQDLVTLSFPNVSDEYGFVSSGNARGVIADHLGGELVVTSVSRMVNDPNMVLAEGVATVTTKPGPIRRLYQVIASSTEPYFYNEAVVPMTQALIQVSRNNDPMLGARVRYTHTYSSEDSSSAVQTTRTFTYTTRDFIFCDPDEQVYVYFEVRVDTVINAKYVVSFRGVKTDFVVTKDMALSSVTTFTSIWAGGRQISVTGDHGGQTQPFYTPPAVPVTQCAPPPPLICAPFTTQANCPYIAYTTKAEELRGVIPEIYVDFNVRPVRPLGWTGNSSSKYDGVVDFLAIQFNHMAFNLTPYDASSQKPDSAFPWDAVTGGNTPFRIQMANNVAGPWESKLGTPFVDGTQLEITRT